MFDFFGSALQIYAAEIIEKIVDLKNFSTTNIFYCIDQLKKSINILMSQ